MIHSERVEYYIYNAEENPYVANRYDPFREGRISLFGQVPAGLGRRSAQWCARDRGGGENFFPGMFGARG